MKKFFLLTLGLGIFAVSCGTKESSMSSSNADSATIDTTMTVVPPVTADTTSTKMTTPDSIKIKMDSATTVK